RTRTNMACVLGVQATAPSAVESAAVWGGVTRPFSNMTTRGDKGHGTVGERASFSTTGPRHGRGAGAAAVSAKFSPAADGGLCSMTTGLSAQLNPRNPRNPPSWLHCHQGSWSRITYQEYITTMR